MPSTLGLSTSGEPRPAAMQATVDDQGRLVLPPDVAARLGFEPGAVVQLDPDADGVYLRRSVMRLAKVYVEPTNACNLTCRTCMRNVWDEPPGFMDERTFARLLDDLRRFPPPLTVFFGGYGEPLSHPRIVDMVQAAKTLGAQVELITNGTLLNETRARGLITAGLDRLWVSLDGATPDSFQDVRLGAALPSVLANLARFRDLRQPTRQPTPEIGIVFVAMRRNLHDLPAVLRLGSELGAVQLMVSNVLPHTEDLRDDVLYTRTLSNDEYYPSPRLPRLILPRMDTDILAALPLDEATRGVWAVTFVGDRPGEAGNRCPFIERGATAVGWDGSVSPCLPLLHTHTGYLNGLEREERRYVIGKLPDRSLHDLWSSPEYSSFRARVQAFDFAPCTICDGCPLSASNDEDCYATPFPSCGGCLWAQGIVQCP